MPKKSIIIFLIIILTAILIAAVVYFANLYQNYKTLNQSPSGLKIKSESLEKFLEKAKVIDANGDKLIEETNDYQIIYLAKTGQFYINILGQPFETIKKRAEDHFLKITNLKIEKICGLNVIIATPEFINPRNAEQEYTFRSCPNPTP